MPFYLQCVYLCHLSFAVHIPACRSFGSGTSPNVTPFSGTPTASAQSSPNVRTKRYVLSTAAKREVETQTVADIWSLEEQGTLSATELQSTLFQVRETVTVLNEENQVQREEGVQDLGMDVPQLVAQITGVLHLYICTLVCLGL